MYITGEKPSLIRDINLKLVIDSLRKGDLSVTDLAKKLNLSNTAVKKIINELIDLNVVKEANKVISKVAGRRKVNYHYNSDFGKIGIINFAQKEIYLCNMLGDIIIQEKLPDNQINLKYIINSVQKLKGLCSELISLCIITIGKIDTTTNNFIYALNVDDYQHINFKNIVSKYYDCPIIIKNDIYAGLCGEIKSGMFNDIKNGLYVYVGDSISSGLLINGKIYEGSRNFAGEIGLFSSNNYERLEDILSLKSLKKKCNDIDYDIIIKKYNNKESDIVKIVNLMAKELAIILKNVTLLLDIELIVLSGEFTKLGDSILKEIKEYFKLYDYLNVRIEYSKLQQNAIVIGAKEEAITTGISYILKSRKEK